MGAISDDEDQGFTIRKMSGKHKKFADDHEATTVTREEFEEFQKMALENKRRSLENEARSKLAQQRSLDNQKRLLSEVVITEPPAEDPAPKPKRGRPAKKDKETKVKEEKPKSQAQIAKEIKKVEAELKKVQKLYTKEMGFLKDQKEVMKQYEDWFTQLADKPQYKDDAPVFNRINYAVGSLYGLRDSLEAMKGYDFPELKEKGHPLMDLKTYLLALGNTMDTTGILGLKVEHKELKAKREELLALQNPVDEFELK